MTSKARPAGSGPGFCLDDLSVIPYDSIAMGHETSYFYQQQNKDDE